MARATIVNSLVVTTPNEAGTLGHMTHKLDASEINIIHMCAYVKDDKGYFLIITQDNEKAAAVIKELGHEATAAQAVEIEFKNKPGTLAPIARKLGENGIDINCIFATSADGKKVLGIISTNNNKKAVELINEQS